MAYRLLHQEPYQTAKFREVTKSNKKVSRNHGENE
jgi:hypothetical protein